MILDGKSDGYYNMAVDEAILVSYSSQRIPTLRIYGWREPFVSLGYGQKVEEVLTFKESIPFARRMTAGSSILHDQELTYSIVSKLDDLGLPYKVKESYRILCSFLKDFYGRLGLNVQFAQDVFSRGLGRYGSFCFSTCEHFDFIIKGKKIGGNAQRRKKDLIFQQGSIPQEIDFGLVKSAIHDVGILEEKTVSLNEILNKETDFFYLRSLLAESFQRAFNLSLVPSRLTLQEKEICNDLVENKYKQKSWNVGRINYQLN